MRAFFNDTILAKRWVLSIVHLSTAAVMVAVALVDHTTWSAAIGFFVAGFLVGGGIYTIIQPGLLSTWRGIDQAHIQSQLQEMFQSVVEHHNERQDPDHKPPGGLN